METVLKQEIGFFWDECEFEIKNTQDISDPCIIGGDIEGI